MVANGEKRSPFFSITNCPNEIVMIVDVCGVKSLHPKFAHRPDCEESDVRSESPNATFQGTAIEVVRKWPRNVKGHDFFDFDSYNSFDCE